MRRSGQTTRIVDRTVQQLFKNGVSFVSDHHPAGNRYMLGVLQDRMIREHNIQVRAEQVYDDSFVVYIPNYVQNSKPKSIWQELKEFLQGLRPTRQEPEAMFL